jgi:hypothetical protein
MERLMRDRLCPKVSLGKEAFQSSDRMTRHLEIDLTQL